jgi:hypothetical protein
MNWEKSKALTPLKRDFLVAFFAREQNFYLTGGSALGIFYLEHRLSYDLDLFSTEEIDWRFVKNVFIDITESINAEWEAITSSPYLHRFKLKRGNEAEIIDFIAEKVPQVDQKKMSFDGIRVDTLREIGANKLCTLVSRSEIKDFIDLYFLEQAGFKAIDHITEAQQKDNGFDPATVSYLLSQITIPVLPHYLLKPLTPADLREYIKKLQKQMADRAFPAI